MALLREEERRNTAESLKQHRTRAIDTINILKSIKTDLNQLKADISADVNGTALYYESADITDVQSIIDEINTEIGTV